jgi:Fe-S cluster assembly protein SufD
MMIPAVDHCKTEFERASRRRPPSEPMHFRHQRWEALERFLLTGFPVAALADRFFTMANEPAAASRDRDLAHGRLPGRCCAEVVFINGYFVHQASSTQLPVGLHVESLSSAISRGAEEVTAYLSRVAPPEELPLVALNTALFVDGVCLRIGPGVRLPEPVHIRFISTGEADMRPAMSHPRVLIVAGEDSDSTVVESYAGPDEIEYLTNAVSEVVLGVGAHLEHSSVQEEGRAALHVRTRRVRAGSGATLSTRDVQRGAAFVRCDEVSTIGNQPSESRG